MTQKAPPAKGWKSTKQAGAVSFGGGGKTVLSSCFLWLPLGFHTSRQRLISSDPAETGQWFVV
jgi:hypothetical protein